LGGKSRKTGAISKKLIDKIRNASKLKTPAKKKSDKKKQDPFGLGG
jgi:hypothetical protein